MYKRLKHHLPQAALPLFCDRCRKSLLQQSNQAVYLQEADSRVPIGKSGLRMCSTCFNHLRVTRQRDRAAFKSDVQKFTHECTHAGGEPDEPPAWVPKDPANEKEVGKCYRKACLYLHPDKVSRRDLAHCVARRGHGGRGHDGQDDADAVRGDDGTRGQTSAGGVSDR